jgi:hypothetical protein
MFDDDRAVTMARWTPATTFEACAGTMSAVRAFAQDHGMRPDDVDAAAFALADALVPMVEARHDGLAVDAATDGLWLTLQAACGPDHALLELPTGAQVRGSDG